MSENLLLASLPEDIRARFDSVAESVTLPLKTYVMRIGEPIAHVYFPVTGLISVVVNLSDGDTVETLTISNEGFSGISLLLGQMTGTREAFVQIAGDFIRIPTADFVTVLATDARLRSSLEVYVNYALRVVEQSAACLAFHPLEARLARWLLSVNDRLPGEMHLTHEFLGQMLGVYRPSVTLAIGILHESGFITSKRGVIQITNREALEHAACECYSATKFWPSN